MTNQELLQDPDKIINNYMKKSDFWTSLLEKENERLTAILSTIIDKLPIQYLKEDSPSMVVGSLYLKAYNIISVINNLREKNSKTLIARFVLLRAVYETMCSFYYAIEFPEKVKYFLDDSKKLSVSELHKGFAHKDAKKMYEAVYRLLCRFTHTDIAAAKSLGVVRIYSFQEKKVALEDPYGQIKRVDLELIFNYHYWMIQNNLITIFLQERDYYPKIIESVIINYLEELFPENILEELSTWQKQKPTLDLFIAEVDGVMTKYKNKPIKVKKIEDVKQKIEEIYELRENPKLIEDFKNKLDFYNKI